MGSLSKWVHYVRNRVVYSLGVSTKMAQTAENKSYEVDLLSLWRNFVRGRLTYLHRHMGDEMVPVLAGKGEVLLVRKLPLSPIVDTFVGDIVVMKDPESPEDQLVRRVAAMEGDEMISSDDKDEAFVLDEDQFWVISDNEAKKVKEARDSRTFGPISKENIVGRVIYRVGTAKDHGPVENSTFGMYQDWSVLAVELDVDEMAKRSSKT